MLTRITAIEKQFKSMIDSEAAIVSQLKELAAKVSANLQVWCRLKAGRIYVTTGPTPPLPQLEKAEVKEPAEKSLMEDVLRRCQVWKGRTSGAATFWRFFFSRPMPTPFLSYSFLVWPHRVRGVHGGAVLRRAIVHCSAQASHARQEHDAQEPSRQGHQERRLPARAWRQ